MKYETEGAAIEECIGLTSKKVLFLVAINKHEKAKRSNVVATTSHNENKDVLFNKECIRHQMNRIQSKDLITV